VTSTPLLTIGAFARAVGLTPSALRHYDECGLLVPAEVDDATGYRYYTPDLAHRTRLIVGMREAGMPIEAMRRVLDGDVAEAREALGTFRDEQVARAARTRSSLNDVLASVEAGTSPIQPAQARLDGPVLSAALRQVRPAADADPTSPLSSVLVDIGDGVDVVATNRYWMAMRTLDADIGGSGRVVLALPVATELAAALDRVGEVTVEISDDALVVRADGDLVHTANGRDVAYPAHRIIRDGLETPLTRAVLPLADLVDAVADAGRADVVLELDSYGARIADRQVGGVVTGRAAKLVLGSALIQRGLAACLGAEVVLEVAEEDRPVVLRSPYQPGFSALVMPIRA
jgi:DNA-binding transcriptional MerR regulator